SLLESHVVVAQLKFPYVPGLLSFREAPALLRAFAKLEKIPDVVLCDGQGLAHPRRLGLASHLGLWLRIPTIGCAKSRLCGEHRMPARTRGSRTKLVHQAELVGTVVRTRDDVRPLYVSVGNLCTLADAVRLTLACSVGYRMPEPTRLADRIVAKARKDFQNRSPKKRPR
ncbi:MAG: endonuclease V, partial [Phycisphaerae bacterium]